MVDRLLRLFLRRGKRTVALLTALVVLGCAVGIPVPRLVNKDTTRPFPCMHHACGCASADACWQGCCCMSDEQKLAWARQHHVSPPAELVVRVNQAAAESSRCCSHGRCDQTDDEVEGGMPAVGLIHIDALRKCQGLSSLWIVLSQAPLPDCAQPVMSDLTLVAWVTPAHAPQLLSPVFDPATPPPRAAI